MDWNGGEWSLLEGDRYRQEYDGMSFGEVRDLQNKILSKYDQNPEPPLYLLEFLAFHNPEKCRILELGGYNGFQALVTLSNRPKYEWANYDISPRVGELTHPKLQDKNYGYFILQQHLYDYNLTEDYDVFYSSKTLEHMRLREVLKTLDKTQHIPYHVHIIDYFHSDDTHVLELDSKQAILDWYRVHGYALCHMEYYKDMIRSMMPDGRVTEFVQLRVLAGKL